MLKITLLIKKVQLKGEGIKKSQTLFLNPLLKS